MEGKAMRERKTIDTWEVQGLYNREFERVTTEYSRKEARAMLKCYRDNEPETYFRIQYKRQKKEGNLK